MGLFQPELFAIVETFTKSVTTVAIKTCSIILMYVTQLMTLHAFSSVIGLVAGVVQESYSS